MGKGSDRHQFTVQAPVEASPCYLESVFNVTARAQRACFNFRIHLYNRKLIDIVLSKDLKG